MKVQIEENYQAMSRRAARRIAREVIGKEETVLALPTGNTPKGTYEELARMHREELVDFSSVVTFNLDEYYSIDPAHPKSFHSYMKKRVWEPLEIPEEHRYIPNGSSKDTSRECERYEREIASRGGIDLAVLGIGQNAHIGFNEPGTAWGRKTTLVELLPETVKGEFPNHPDPPTQAITMGIKTIMGAREILLLASGERKARAIQESLEGPVTEDVPGSVLQLHPNISAYLDEAAASGLSEHRSRLSHQKKER